MSRGTARLRTTAAAAACVVALATLTAACGDDGDGGTGPAATDGASGRDTAEKDPGADAGGDGGEDGTVPKELRFTATTLDGSGFDGASLAGESAVFWFWAPWCTVCAAEAPHVKEAAEEYGEDVTFVGVPGKGGTADMEKFVSAHQLDGFQHAVDADGTVWSRFGVAAQPALAFVDKTGKVEVVPGTMSADQLSQRVAELAGP
ncbi:redoxin domain-containing protein [Streptomyces sp. WMMC1477]|uniref:redoxin domain-containing protein n=1 Tax=Streptomyces sp. WMMC1477 TaxID=3015155 RepID=UPI0022B70704|nr:redoxin domain-containing protein [Streptomyces sp. WMMC1477]MCZ7432444.1 redoxin domain-containing protein [Streptomyces sp. WMMC1477]